MEAKTLLKRLQKELYNPRGEFMNAYGPVLFLIQHPDRELHATSKRKLTPMEKGLKKLKLSYTKKVLPGLGGTVIALTPASKKAVTPYARWVYKLTIKEDFKNRNSRHPELAWWYFYPENIFF